METVDSLVEDSIEEISVLFGVHDAPHIEEDYVRFYLEGGFDGLLDMLNSELRVLIENIVVETWKRKSNTITNEDIYAILDDEIWQPFRPFAVAPAA